MTTREFLNTVIKANVSEEVTTYATAALGKLDERNAKRKTTLTPSQKANEAFKEEIKAFLADKEDYTLCSEIAEHFNVKTQKATGVLGLMIKDGTVEAAEIKVKGGKRKGYRLVA